MSDHLIQADGDPFFFSDTYFVPVTFTRSLPKQDFQDLAKNVLYTHNCHFSQTAKKWFCPKDQLDRIDVQARSLLKDFLAEDIGEELGKRWLQG